MEKNIRVLRIDPGKRPKVIEVDAGIESLQKEVGGYVEYVYSFEDMVVLVLNEEGKILNLPANRALYDPDGQICDILCGTFLVAGVDSEQGTCSLTDEQVERYSEMYRYPETFCLINDGLVALKYLAEEAEE